MRTWTVPPVAAAAAPSPMTGRHMAVLVTDVGNGQVSFASESVRGDDAKEALADLLMGPGGASGAAVLLPGLVAVVVRRGIDVMWMAQPPIQVSPTGNGEEVEIAVAGSTRKTR
jgi:hypothetical protein